MALITQSDLEERLGRSLTDDEASAFTIQNDAAQAYVERMLGSSVESVSATTRYYDGGRQHIPIDPATDVTILNLVDDDSIVTDTLDTTDYVLEPQNRELKYMVRWRSSYFPTGINNLKVTAKFSIYEDEAARNIVKNVILDMLTQTIRDTSTANNSNIKRESIEGYSVEYGDSSSSLTTASITNLNLLLPPMIL